MKYAVVASGGKQYKVTEGEIVTVDKLALEKDAAYVFPEVLLVVNADAVHVGTPIVVGATVHGTVVEQKKGDKIRVDTRTGEYVERAK